jgi:hypothetical protein
MTWKNEDDSFERNSRAACRGAEDHFLDSTFHFFGGKIDCSLKMDPLKFDCSLKSFWCFEEPEEGLTEKYGY